MSKIENFSRTDELSLVNEVEGEPDAVWKHDVIEQEVAVFKARDTERDISFYEVDLFSQADGYTYKENVYEEDTKEDAMDRARGLMKRHPEGVTSKGGIEPEQMDGDMG